MKKEQIGQKEGEENPRKWLDGIGVGVEKLSNINI